MMLGLSEALPGLVRARYEAAEASLALKFSPTELSIIHASAGFHFQLRYCPSLGKKPEPLKANTQKKKIDPFEDPEKELFIANLPARNSSHLLVLNKYPIIPKHFILATKINKQQTHKLEQDDLEITYACLKAWHEEASGGRQTRLFAFFNSGEHSGASQPHRHLQFLPIESMHEGEKSANWDVLIDSVLSSAEGQDAGDSETIPPVIQDISLPFTTFAYKFSSEPSSPQLLTMYNSLYQKAKEAVDNFIAANPGQLALHEANGGSLPISYNLAMTTAGMAIMPRRSEGYTLRHNDGADAGYVQLNGTALGGTLMVKHQEQYDILRQRPEQLDSVLEAIGIPLKYQATKL